MKKLKCIVVDDNHAIHELVREQCIDSSYVEIVADFDSPTKFLDALPTLDFDVCLLDIFMPLVDGLTVAKILKDKLVVFITSVYTDVPDALALSPVDVVLKPITKTRLNMALRKAYFIRLGEKVGGGNEARKKHEMFRVGDHIGKVKVTLSEIAHVETDELDRRNKRILLTNGSQYTIMDYSMEELMKLAPQLVQVNISELISTDTFHDIKQDVIRLKGIKSLDGRPKCVMLGRAFKKDFNQLIAVTQ